MIRKLIIFPITIRRSLFDKCGNALHWLSSLPGNSSVEKLQQYCSFASITKSCVQRLQEILFLHRLIRANFALWSCLERMFGYYLQSSSRYNLSLYAANYSVVKVCEEEREEIGQLCTCYRGMFCQFLPRIRWNKVEKAYEASLFTLLLFPWWFGGDNWCWGAIWLSDLFEPYDRVSVVHWPVYYTQLWKCWKR
jgi:hypothetical protein